MIKNNIRVFGWGPQKNWTVKIGLASSFRSGSLMREILVRCKMNLKHSYNLFPGFIGYDHVNHSWFVEEEIEQVNNFNKVTILNDFLINYAYDFYNATLSYRSALVKYPNLKINSLELDNFIVPIALCHGDLSPGNMIKDEYNKFFLIDLELSDFSPIADDLVKIYLTYPESRKLIISLLEQFSNAPNMLTAETQMAIALLKRSQNLSIERHVNYHVEALGLSKEEAVEHINQIQLECQRLANGLLELNINN